MLFDSAVQLTWFFAGVVIGSVAATYLRMEEDWYEIDGNNDQSQAGAQAKDDSKR
tara:strand:+ start:5620 stop:5784 length:165 start_codon:yes stop_codon:yes gene_type:complete